MVVSGLKLPKPARVCIRSFSLYDNASEIKTDFGDGVFCLAGANGLGKSTFLAVVGFCVTGVVAEPGRVFNSADEYLKNCRSYSHTAFDGRISETDRPTAEVELVMHVGSTEYRIVRNIFEPTALRTLETKQGGSDDWKVPKTGSDEERHQLYETMLARDVGVRSFSQFVMIHHLVQTFDERRHLLFWDHKVSQAALFLAFGLDPEEAKKADDLRRQAERADSRARNHQYAATTTRKRLRELVERMERLSEDDQDIAEELVQLQSQEDQMTRIVQEVSVRYQDAELGKAGVAARLRATREQYERAYSEALFGRRDPVTHPVVRAIRSTSNCPVCGYAGDDVGMYVEKVILANRCPLCVQPIVAVQEFSDALAQLDVSVRGLESELEEAELQVNRCLSDLKTKQRTLSELRDRLRQIEGSVEGSIITASQAGESLELLIQSFERDIKDRMRRKTDERS